MDKIIFNITKQFKLEGDVIDIIPYGSGLINNTYLIKTDITNYIIQKINTYVFKKPEKLMENIHLITKYIKEKGGNSLELIKTKDNLVLFNHKNGYFRCYKMIYNCKSFDTVTNNDLLIRVGKTIGIFQHTLKDFDTDKIYVTIPNFHDLKFRYYELINAYRKTSDNKRNEIKLLFYKILCSYKNVNELSNIIEKGIIKKRICHYDTKLNNFLFSETKKDFLIDLDTVMPGISIFDFGDCARNVIVDVKEDESNKEIKINFSRFVSLVTGYLSVGKNYLSKVEVNNLVNSIKLISLELSIRFLIDYLEDNVYFKVDYENQNLNRSICQFNIFYKVKEKEVLLNNIVNNIYQRLSN